MIFIEIKKIFYQIRCHHCDLLLVLLKLNELNDAKWTKNETLTPYNFFFINLYVIYLQLNLENLTSIKVATQINNIGAKCFDETCLNGCCTYIQRTVLNCGLVYIYFWIVFIDHHNIDIIITNLVLYWRKFKKLNWEHPILRLRIHFVLI